MYRSVSFIHPMFHFKSNPSPPTYVGPRHRRPRRGLFRNRQRPGMLRVQHFVQLS